MRKATMPASRKALALNLKKCLQDQELSEAELARRSGVSQKHVNNATNERTSSSIEIVELMAKALHVPGWSLMMMGLHDEDSRSIERLAGLVASWIGADDAGRKILEMTGSKLSSMNAKK